MKFFRSFLFLFVFVCFSCFAQNNERNVFGGFDHVGVIVNNKVQFYQYRGDSWAVSIQVAEMTLPN